jgi:hypothetical protein
VPLFTGEDALVDVVDASDMNSIAGVLKLYFRELREPLFPLHLFDALVECTRKFLFIDIVIEHTCVEDSL